MTRYKEEGRRFFSYDKLDERKEILPGDAFTMKLVAFIDKYSATGMPTRWEVRIGAEILSADEVVAWGELLREDIARELFPRLDLMNIPYGR